MPEAWQGERKRGVEERVEGVVAILCRIYSDESYCQCYLSLGLGLGLALGHVDDGPGRLKPFVNQPGVPGGGVGG